jgi:hypothetical protein
MHFPCNAYCTRYLRQLEQYYILSAYADQAMRHTEDSRHPLKVQIRDYEMDDTVN